VEVQQSIKRRQQHQMTLGDWKIMGTKRKIWFVIVVGKGDIKKISVSTNLIRVRIVLR